MVRYNASRNPIPPGLRLALKVADFTLERASQLVRGAPEFTEPLTKGSGDSGKLFRSEQQKSNEQKENEFKAVDQHREALAPASLASTKEQTE
jgi:hypothetical protein